VERSLVSSLGERERATIGRRYQYVYACTCVKGKAERQREREREREEERCIIGMFSSSGDQKVDRST
jgi:hypothetical protein